MKTIGFAFVAILWWIAIWGIVDTIIHTWGRGQKMASYIILLLIATGLMYSYPDAMDHL